MDITWIQVQIRETTFHAYQSSNTTSVQDK